MVKGFWVCKVTNVTRKNKGDSNLSLEFMLNCVYLKDAKKYIRNLDGLYPSNNYTILEVWQKEVT